ncbi:MAG: hypothetical protein FJ137_09525 [Deltaproteobacteria bacterium]|nr:hypothetical protein [Deltaproteobacteria bacterium]
MTPTDRPAPDDAMTPWTPRRAAADPRPDWTPALERLLSAITASVPPLAGLPTDDVLVVGLAAHGTGAASVRELRDVAARVVVDGHRRQVELGLRPPFLLDADAPRRLATLVHELLHLDPVHPGRLLAANRHAHRSHTSLEREARAHARRLLDDLDPALLLCLAHDGEVLLRQWRHRPAETTRRRVFGDADVFVGPVVVRTPADRRGGWW